jgi:acylphosphatase
MKIHYNIWVKGVVQGVFFLKFTRIKANELEITGFARNLPDGRVYIEAEGEPESMKLLVDWIKTNPGKSMVEDVRVVEHKMINHLVFIIK